MRRAYASGATAVIALATAAADAQQWAQFRGPGGQGVAADDCRAPVTLDAAVNRRWVAEVGDGHSSPCIWGDRIFLTACGPGRLDTVALDRGTGAIAWRRSVPVESIERHHRINGPATPTPTTDGARVVVSFGSCGLVCYDVDGEPQWERRLPVATNSFGTAASPIFADGRLIFANDRRGDSFLEAIDPATGVTIWRTDRSDFGPGWSTPVHRQLDGAGEILVYGAWWLTAYDLADGSTRWALPGLTDEPCITPAVGDGMVFLTSYNMKTNPEVVGLPSFDELLETYDADADGALTRDEVRTNRSILSRHEADGEGDHPLPGFFRFLDEDRDGNLTPSEWQRMIAFVDGFKHANALMAIRPEAGAEAGPAIVWRHHRGVPECPSPLYHDGRVYMVKNGGIMSCLDARTGALHYSGRLGSGGPYYASPVTAGGRIYAASARGVVTVLAAGDELEVLARNDLGERIMATPALVDDTIYVRTATRLHAFGAPAPPDAAP